MMDSETIKDYCAAKRGVTSDYPFDEVTRVYRVMGKIFVLIPEDGALSMNLKCDPALAEILRQTHTAVKPGYHMNKSKLVPNSVTVLASYCLPRL